MNNYVDIGAIRAALESHMARKGISGRDLSREAGLNETAVRDLLNKVTDPRIGTLCRLAKALDVSPETLFGGSVEIAGRVNEDGEILPNPENPNRVEIVPRPPEAIGNVLAYRIEGDDLMPAYRAGDVVYVSREQELGEQAFDGMECAVQIAATGAMLLRTVHKADKPGRFNLSIFKFNKPLENVQLAWAAPVLFVMRHQLGGDKPQ